MKEDRIYLEHIRECLGHVESFTKSGRDQFLADRKTQDAVLRNLQTMAESVSRLSIAVREHRPEVDWRGIIGFRNVLVHGYLGINLTRVWRIVEQDVPVLRAAVEILLAAQ